MKHLKKFNEELTPLQNRLSPRQANDYVNVLPEDKNYSWEAGNFTGTVEAKNIEEALIKSVKSFYKQRDYPSDSSFRLNIYVKEEKKFNEEFDSSGYESHWVKFDQWLSEKDFDLYDGREDLYNKFIEVANDDNLASEEKAGQITDYLDEKWGVYDGYMEIYDYLESLFMDEI